MDHVNVAAPAPLANMGEPIPRSEAVAKVTGKLTYAADTLHDTPLQAYFLTSGIARGQILSIDTAPAEALDGRREGLHSSQRAHADRHALHTEGRLRLRHEHAPDRSRDP